ncbi:MAG: hypothetical protein LBU11_02490 [Zoogloeaceae bacterium]|jgi:hypothetical protein|nr:hypothetical protein [Zoogloeaceae bacterium]
MRLTWDKIQANAFAFSKRWQDGWNEKSEAQSFIRDFLAVFGAQDAAAVGRFEERGLRDGGRGYMDYFWPKKLAVEMKTRGKLKGALAQLQEYVLRLPAADMPELLMISDFERIELVRRTANVRVAFKTRDLHKHIRQFAGIAGYETARAIEEQTEVNIRAAEKMAKLHDALKLHGYDGHDLEVYLVRLLFCMFAEDTGIFPRQSWLNYIENSQETASDLAGRIARVFEVLDMPDAVRAKRTLLSSDLWQFRYINGGLFQGALPFADFDAKMRQALIDCARFDWSAISPAIFGAMFQGVMDKERRREIGAHYTSEENILKLINPLFLDELWQEFERVKTVPKALERFHDKLAELRFLDPACGCGNFLIITYRELRKLELEILKMRLGGSQKVLDLEHLASLLKVRVGQFHGIECEEFPCQIAQAGMWLMDHQMNLRVSEFFGAYYARLPLTQSAAIVHGNALRLDWNEVVPKEALSYILGNPPFSGARVMGAAQKADMEAVFGDAKNAGNLDYVTAWFKKAAQMMSPLPDKGEAGGGFAPPRTGDDATCDAKPLPNPSPASPCPGEGGHIQTAFVATNSISQGEQVAILWKPLIERHHLRIRFAYRTFKWSNEAKGKAAVHCVIVGFGRERTGAAKTIVNEKGERIAARNINGYLIDAPDIFIENRNKPLWGAPEIGIGNKPIDDGNYLFTEAEKDEFLKIEPRAAKWFRPWLGADEFLNGYRRYCLWLGECTPAELRAMPNAMRRIEAVKNFRLASKSEGTRKIAAKPTRFHVENMPESNYIVIPEVSSERRLYIPFGFLTPDVLCSNKLRLMPGGTLYHFGVLASIVHMAWTRVVTGRLEMRYQYSVNIVYNNFPWPNVTPVQRAAIEAAARAVLDMRKRFPDSSLADLYDPLAMPPELVKAHARLDRAVMAAYGYAAKDFSEAACVADLLRRYQERKVEDKVP